MEKDQIITQSMDDFLKEIALNGMFLKYLSLKAEAEMREEQGGTCTKTYILEDASSNLYKIGKSSNVRKRASMLKCANPFISIFAIIDFDCEEELHKLFDGKRFEREWFRLSKEDIDFIVKNYNAKLY